MLTLKDHPNGSLVAPRQELTITGTVPGTLTVLDGQGRAYFEAPTTESGPVLFRAGGALGAHTVLQYDDAGKLAGTLAFRMGAATRIEDEGGFFQEMLAMIYQTMVCWGDGGQIIRLDGKFYRHFVCWLRDHVHVLKGLKWYTPHLKTGIELYADYQREDGLIWDRVEQAKPDKHWPTWRDMEFAEGGFIIKVNGGTWRFERIPVENDVEYLFLEGLYHTWKATGDTAWMSRYLDNAIRAVGYSTSDPYRWSQKYQLLKRGYTIDTWDFQSEYDAERSGSPMRVVLDRTEFNIMHGDNSGMAVGCLYLAEMLEAAGRGGEAATFRQLGRDLQERLDELSWNGRFYTHQVPENPQVERDFGVDPNEQVSLSNAYNTNRAIAADKARAIIETYQRIREEMPRTSPGEFYQIYPPFEKGFGRHNGKWQYMNGGVTTIVAGELAHGAFTHGYEAYGADILRRVFDWGRKHDGYFDCCLKGALPEPGPRRFECVDLTGIANCDYHDEGAEGVPAFHGEGAGNDLSRLPSGRSEFLEIPFEVIDPAAHGRRGCLGLSGLNPGYARALTQPVGKTARSLYFLHALYGRGNTLAGEVVLHYDDGSEHREYVLNGQNIGAWFLPGDPATSRGHKRTCAVAWRGANDAFDHVGVYLWGLDNPHPDKPIASVEWVAADTEGIWFTFALTLGQEPVRLPDTDVSYGIPDNWGAAALMYALMEGLAGVKDGGVAFDRAILAPRWPAAGVKKVAVTGHYPASEGYVDYEYTASEDGRLVEIAFTSSAERTELSILMQPGTSLNALVVDNQPTEARVEGEGASQYACTTVTGVGVHHVRLELG
jgi:hypothetical protein